MKSKKSDSPIKEKYMNSYLSEFHNQKLHAAYFTYNKKRYVFSGWWLLEWDDGDKEYDTIDEFLNDPVFEGKRLEEIIEEITDVFFDHEP